MVYVLIATCFVIIVTGIIAPLFVYIETGNPAWVLVTITSIVLGITATLWVASV